MQRSWGMSPMSWEVEKDGAEGAGRHSRHFLYLMPCSAPQPYGRQ